MFVVGHYDSVTSDYRHATPGDWTNPQFQAALVEAHQKHGGWPILDELPFYANSPLCVDGAEAKVHDYNIDHRDSYKNDKIDNTNVYSAMFESGFDPTHPVWITHPPKPDSNMENPNWTCKKKI